MSFSKWQIAAALFALALPVVAQAALVVVPVTFNSVGTFDPGGGSGLTASEAGGVVHLQNGGGTGFSFAIYDLSTPQPADFMHGLTYSIKVNAADSPYTANPMFVIDADGSGGINPTTNVPAWFYATTPANLGNTGPGTGDSFISSDVNVNASGVAPEAGFSTHVLIGPGQQTEGWYGSAASQSAFEPAYLPYDGPGDSIIQRINSGGFGGTQGGDLVYQVWFILGGSGSFTNADVEINDVTLSIPEPASIGLLGLGGLLMLRRRSA